MIRATTGGVLKSYRSNLMNSFIKMNGAVNTVLTQRNFTSYAEDPASASQAFQLRRARMATDNQYSICDATYRKYEQARTAMVQVEDVLDTGDINSIKDAALRVLNTPTGDAVTTLGKTLSQLADTILQDMNTTYGDTFVFAGADGMNVPFTYENDQLYYRGVPVDTAIPTLKTDASGDPVTVDAAGKVDPAGEYYQILNGNVISKVDYEQSREDWAKLQYMANDEKYFVDIGLGFKWNDSSDRLIESSGFNAALQGINFLGYGLDEDGDPKNIISIVKRMEQLCTTAGTGEDGGWPDYDEFNRLTSKLEQASAALKVKYTDMDAETTKLKNNLELLDDKSYTLTEQYGGIEDVDMADAISSFIWAQYCYNAALKMGNSILAPSLMDYLS